MDDIPTLVLQRDGSPKALLRKALEVVNGALIGGAHCAAALRPAAIRRCNSAGSIITRRPSLTAATFPCRIQALSVHGDSPTLAAASRNPIAICSILVSPDKIYYFLDSGGQIGYLGVN